MFSNLASLIFGNSTSNEETVTTTTPKVEDDWVVVGGEGHPQLTLGSMSDGVPRPATGSTGSSTAPSESGPEDGDEEMVIVENDNDFLPTTPNREVVALTRSGRRLTNPLAQANGLSLSQVKALRSSQKAKSKDSGKQLTAKATERHNKAVKNRSNHHSSKKASANLAIRSSGINKHLKQC